MDSLLLKIERACTAIVGFCVFMFKNLLISGAFLGVLLLLFPGQFVSLLESIRPIQTENFHKGTMKLLVGDRPKTPQKVAAGGSDFAEVGFDANGQALPEERKDYAELNTMNERRVASLEEEVTHLRGELRKLKVKYQYGGVEPTTEPMKPKWSWKTMLGITPKEEAARQ